MNFRPDRFRKVGIPARKKARIYAPLPPPRWEEDRLVIVLPIPVLAVRPNNGNLHWSKVRKAKKEAKTRATLMTLELVNGRPAPCAVAYSLVYYFEATMWDDDNAIASVKAYLDGICAALGMDDRHLRFRELIRRSDRQCPRLEMVMHLAL